MRARYARAVARAASATMGSEHCPCRAAITMLAHSRFTSHSHGAGWVSSKSFTSKARLRSGVANRPKFRRWASPHACTRIPLLAVVARSAAITAGEPR